MEIMEIRAEIMEITITVTSPRLGSYGFGVGYGNGNLGMGYRQITPFSSCIYDRLFCSLSLSLDTGR
jgi:hypothetical protein